MPEKLCGSWHRFAIALSSTCSGEINVRLVTNICFLTGATLKTRSTDRISALKNYHNEYKRAEETKFSRIAEGNNRLLN